MRGSASVNIPTEEVVGSNPYTDVNLAAKNNNGLECLVSTSPFFRRQIECPGKDRRSVLDHIEKYSQYEQLRIGLPVMWMQVPQ